MEATRRVRASPIHVQTLAVAVVDGPDKGASTIGEIVTVGTAEGSNLRLSDSGVSRFHLELAAAHGGIMVRDHGSTNGTFAGGIRIEKAVVPLGTVLKLGDTSVRVGDAGTTEIETIEGIAGLVGRAPAMRRLFAQIDRAAASDVSVLINGESGTGKELVARALHDLGPRAKKPFVTVDCGSLPPTLLASELFGHERGAFTGADRTHIGAFEAAQGGTVFLDEIGELQPAVQATLLGVLERRRVRRLGSRSEINVDVRVVAATHRDLRAEVNRNGFRLDLYYRLAVVTLAIPALRDRPDDVPLLVEHFLRDSGWDQPVGALISPAAMEALQRMHFEGNVRELRNLIEAAVAMGEAPVQASSVPMPASTGGIAIDLALPYKEARAALTTEFERRYIDALLERTGGNVSAAARAAQLTRSHLNELITKLKR
ncbi:MAG: sigma 54-interacting transcriptional regulator [Kofleriaceae bacterium]